MTNKVLIIEDDIFSAKLLQQILRNSGYDTIIAENGQIGIDELLKDDGISACMLDLNMPVMDGYEFLNEISKDTTFDKLNIYITSCNSEEVFVRNISDQKINIGLIKGYFEKPFDFSNIIAKLA
jgi:two-component system, chemotaxis family, chemotaxis protein CheY